MFEYAARVERVIDGDTIVCLLDLGLNVFRRETLRLNGVNTPETNSPDSVERVRAQRAKDYVADVLLPRPSLDIVTAIGKLATEGKLHEIVALLPKAMTTAAERVIVRTAKPYETDKYGRWLGTVLYKRAGDTDWRDLNQEIIDQGLGVPYGGGKR